VLYSIEQFLDLQRFLEL